MKIESGSHSVMSDSLQPHGLYSPWKSLGQNTRVGSISLLQRIFPTQGSNPGLPHCRRILYQLRYQGTSRNLPVKTKNSRDKSSIPGLERSSGGGNRNPLQFS